MATINRFEDLEIWQEARRLSKMIQKIATETDLKTDFKFKEQIKSSSGSVMDNLAEGFERDGNLEFRQFLSIAKGSAGETRSQLYRVFDYGYINQQLLDELKNDYEKLSGKLKTLFHTSTKKTFKETSLNNLKPKKPET